MRARSGRSRGSASGSAAARRCSAARRSSGRRARRPTEPHELPHVHPRRTGSARAAGSRGSRAAVVDHRREPEPPVPGRAREDEPARRPLDEVREDRPADRYDAPVERLARAEAAEIGAVGRDRREASSPSRTRCACRTATRPGRRRACSDGLRRAVVDDERRCVAVGLESARVGEPSCRRATRRGRARRRTARPAASCRMRRRRYPFACAA